MSDQLNKLEEAQRINYKIKGVEKYRDLINKVLINHVEAGTPLPPIWTRPNAIHSGSMDLNPLYLPMQLEEFWHGYVSNIELHIESLKGELEEVMK